MASAPISTSILRLAAPMMVGMVAQMIYNMTDMFFIGQTGNPNLVAGISLTMPLFMFSQGIGNLFATGSASYISRMLGAKNVSEAKHTSAVSFYTTLVTGIVVTVFLLIFKTPLLHLIGTSDITFEYANDYFSIIAMFIIPAVLGMSLSGQMRSEGATQKAMVSMLIGIIINIILDPIFILALGWGVKGAAWASVAGMCAGMVYSIGYFMSKNTILSIKWKDFKPSKKMYSEILKIGVPSALSNLVMTVSSVLTNIIAASYGDFVVAGNGVNMRVVMMCFTFVMALAIGFQPFAGFNYGAKNYDRLRKGFNITLIYTTVLAVFFSGLFIFFGRYIIMAFINDPATVEAGNTLLHAFVWGLPCLGIQMTIMVSFQAMGKPMQATIITLGRQCLFYIPLLLLLNHLFQFNGYIYAQPIADILTTVIALLFSVSIFKAMKHTMGNTAVPAISDAASNPSVPGLSEPTGGSL
jgi:putative MATE family efflux protein